MAALLVSSQACLSRLFFRSLLEGGFDDSFQRFFRFILHASTVDENCGRRTDPQAVAVFQIALDFFGELVGKQCVLKLLHILGDNLKSAFWDNQSPSGLGLTSFMIKR